MKTIDYREWLDRKNATIEDWLDTECSRATSTKELSDMVLAAFKRAGLSYPSEPGDAGRSELVTAVTAYGQKLNPAVSLEEPKTPAKPKKPHKPRKKKRRQTEVPPNPQPTPEIAISDVTSSALELAE